MTDPSPLRAVVLSEPPTHIVGHAISQAMRSPCVSKRGAIVYRVADGFALGWGYNDQPDESCDSSAACKATCRHTAVHAEQMALLVAALRHGVDVADLVHVKAVNGLAVPSGQPNCVECSKLALAAGISGVWLLHESGWHRYEAADFHRLSIEGSIARGPQ